MLGKRKGYQVNRRPIETDPEVMEDTSKIVSDNILKWLKNLGEQPDDNAVAMEIAKLAVKDASYGKNGYEIAKSIEDDFMVYPDLELVEILDGIHSDLFSCKDAATKRWVKENAITCPYEVGDFVSFSHGSMNLKGKIEKIDEEKAKCIIVVDGRPLMPIVNYEDMVLVQRKE